MQRLMSVLIAFFLAVSVSSSGHAFGLKTHLWIANRLADDIIDDCKVSLAEANFIIEQDICVSVRQHRGAFLAGALGPDSYPDMITGQVTTHPGIKGDWQTSDWLVHLYADAPEGDRLAFATGYLTHAASDIWAHSYVNAYAGDIFELGDEERAVERRHFVLEKYIDYHLPDGAINAESMRVPATYLRDKMIFNSDAARLAEKSGVALHIPTMFAIRRTVSDFQNNLNALNNTIETTLANVAAEIITLPAKIISVEASFEAPQRPLEVREKQLKIEKDAFDKTHAALQDAIETLKKNKDRIQQSSLEARLAREAANTAEREVTNVENQLADLRNQLTEAQRQLANPPTHVAKEVCREVAKACKNLCWLHPACCLMDRVCETVQEVHEEWQRLTSLVADLQTRKNSLESDANKFAASRSAELIRESTELRAKAEAESKTAILNTAKETAQIAHNTVNLRYELELSATERARTAAAHAENELQNLRQQLINQNAIKDAFQEFLVHINPIRDYTGLVA